MLVKLVMRLLPLIAAGGVATAGTEEGDDLINTIINTVQVVVTEIDMNEIAKLVTLESTLGRELPTSYNLQEWLDERMDCNEKSCGEDHFGNTYRIREDGDNFIIISDGPDGEPDTEDDIEVAAENLSTGLTD